MKREGDATTYLYQLQGKWLYIIYNPYKDWFITALALNLTEQMEVARMEPKPKKAYSKV